MEMAALLFPSIAGLLASHFFLWIFDCADLFHYFYVIFEQLPPEGYKIELKP